MADQQGRPEGDPAQRQHLYSLVVIGSSAGGIEALSTLVGALTADMPIPIVIAQHLDPRHPSHLMEILARRSALPVYTITDRAPLAPGMYVVPADRHVEITDGHLRLLADTLPRPKPSINLLLSSAARAYGERLIAVILTGTGSDGAVGAREVKAAGGTVIIEDPATAAYPGMPASLAPNTVDLVADLARIGPLLQNLVAGTHAFALPEPDPDAVDVADEREQSLNDVLAEVRDISGIDFSRYKRPTILRRLQRRMVATSMSDLTAYSRYLAAHPVEHQRLVASFLIKVTEFFRDPELFRVLRKRVMTDLIAQARAHGNVLRIWSAGCATGEEAYSLAILVAEALQSELEHFRVLIFATDLDEEAIAFARRGTYPREALDGLSDAQIGRYFIKLDGQYEVTKQLRGMIIFGQHDLAQRAPFPHIDLVLCRNVLIYFTHELQTRALQLFAFALRDGGYLALGKAETVRPLEGYFEPIDGTLKLYRRRGERVLGPISHVLDVKDHTLRVTTAERQVPRRPSELHVVPRTTQTTAQRATADRARTTGEWLGNLVLGLPIGVVVVDGRYDIQAINVVAMRLLGIYTAPQGEDLIHLVRSVPTTALRAAIDAAFRNKGTSGAGASGEPAVGGHGGTETVVIVETALDEQRHLHIACYPYAEAEESREPEGMEGVPPHRASSAVAVLILIEDITSVVKEQEQERAAAEHQRTDQMARRSRESAGPRSRDRATQIAEEENARLKEEMTRIAAINRSLLEANQKLTEDVLELRRSNEELLVGHEEAQASAEEVKTLNEELQATNEELVTVNEEMEATVEELHASNEDLQARGREMQQASETMTAQRAASESERARLEAILLSLGDAVLVVDRAGTTLLTNAAYVEMFGDANVFSTAADETGRPLSAEDTPRQRAARGETFAVEFTLTAPDGTRRWFEASGQPIQGVGEELGGVVAIRDITERSLHRLQHDFIALASHELRTPLTTLNAYGQLLGRLFADQPEDDRGRKYTGQVQHQVERLMRLVQDLVDVNRLQNGKFVLAMDRIRLDQVAMWAVEGARATIPKDRDQTIILESPAAPLFVHGDAARLEQLLLNLLTNAITYAPHSKQITVRVRQVGRDAEVQVRDSGSGIPAADLPHIFSRFYQVARTDVGHAGRHGLGLGLYIAHELVEAHGGRIEVTSVEAPHDGHGTTFTIRLPLMPNGSGEPSTNERPRTP